MADAYKLKADASFPKAITTDDEGNALDVLGVNYREGDYVLADDLTKVVRDRAENGQLDHLLDPVSLEEAQGGQEVEVTRVLIPEHEAERVVLENAEATVVVPRDQAIELNSAGADAAREAMEAAKDAGADQRPALTAAEVPSTRAASQGEEVAVIPKESEHVDEERLKGVEQPPGLPVGPDQAAARGGESAAAEPKRRGRPRRQDEAKKATQDAPKAAREAQDKSE